MLARVARRVQMMHARRVPHVDASQLLLEEEPHGRAARAIRARVREGSDVLVVHLPWAGVRDLFRDLAIDLAVCDAPVRAVVVNFASLSVKEDPHGWTLLLSELLDPLGARPPAAVVPLSEEAFRDALQAGFDQAARTGAHALLCCGADALPRKALELVVAAHQRHRQATAAHGPCRLALATAWGRPVELPGAHRIQLPDLSIREGAGRMAELGADLPRDQGNRVVWMLGGVPEWVDRAATHDGPVDEEWRRVLGALYLHLRNALSLARADDAIAARLDALADLAPHPYDAARDDRLIAAGLVRPGPSGESRPTVRLRAPLVARVDKSLTA